MQVLHEEEYEKGNVMPFGRRHDGSRKFNFFGSAAWVPHAARPNPVPSPLKIHLMRNSLRRLRRKSRKTEAHVRRIYEIETLLKEHGCVVDLHTGEMVL